MGRIVGENKHKGTLYPVDSKAICRIIYEVVAVLPTENIKTSVIYCVPIIGKDNEYDMFLYINGWSKIGSGSIDLSDYYTKEEVDGIVADISTLSFKIVQEKPIEDIETNIIYLIPKSGSSAGNIYEEWIYIDNKWELLGTTDIDLSSYMTLAPLNPTAQEIAAISDGQLYSDTVNHKAIIKGGQEFYDTQKIDELLANKQNRIYYEQPKNDFNSYHDDGLPYAEGDLFIDDGTLYKLHRGVPNTGRVYYNRSILGNKVSRSDPPTSSSAAYACKYAAGDIYKKYDAPESNNNYVLVKCYVCKRVFESLNTASWYSHRYEWQEIPIDIYSKSEIDNMIGDIETALSEV